MSDFMKNDEMPANKVGCRTHVPIKIGHQSTKSKQDRKPGKKTSMIGNVKEKTSKIGNLREKN